MTKVNICIDCKDRATIGEYKRCTVCYLLNKMCRLEKQLSRTKTLYWKALNANISSRVQPSVPKTSAKKVETKGAYEILLERVKSGKIDSVRKVYSADTSEYIEYGYCVTRGSYKVTRRARLDSKWAST